MMTIPLIRPYIHFDDVKNDFSDVFESGIFTKGSNVNAFQNEFCAYTGAKFTYFATSATTALWACLKLLDIGPGDEVIVSDFSFPATSNVVEDLGATPIFCDVSLDTFNMRPESLEQKINDKTKAVIFVDALGNPSGLTKIHEICKKNNIPLIEDAACAIGSSEFGKKCGSIADLTCFSFHPRKLLCTGEGGAITTNNTEWSDWFQIKLNHGASGLKGTSLDFPDFGYNFRLPELQCVMGRKQLPMLDDVILERRNIQKSYCNKIAPAGFTPQIESSGAYHNIQSLVFRLDEQIDRDKMIGHLKDNGIEAGIGTYSLSAMTYNKNKYNDVQPNALKLFETTITLPCFSGLNIDYVCDKILKF